MLVYILLYLMISFDLKCWQGTPPQAGRFLERTKGRNAEEKWEHLVFGKHHYPIAFPFFLVWLCLSQPVTAPAPALPTSESVALLSKPSHRAWFFPFFFFLANSLLVWCWSLLQSFSWFSGFWYYRQIFMALINETCRRIHVTVWLPRTPYSKVQDWPLGH